MGASVCVLPLNSVQATTGSESRAEVSRVVGTCCLRGPCRARNKFAEHSKRAIVLQVAPSACCAREAADSKVTADAVSLAGASRQMDRLFA